MRKIRFDVRRRLMQIPYNNRASVSLFVKTRVIAIDSDQLGSSQTVEKVGWIRDGDWLLVFLHCHTLRSCQPWPLQARPPSFFIYDGASGLGSLNRPLKDSHAFGTYGPNLSQLRDPWREDMHARTKHIEEGYINVYSVTKGFPIERVGPLAIEVARGLGVIIYLSICRVGEIVSI